MKERPLQKVLHLVFSVSLNVTDTGWMAAIAQSHTAFSALKVVSGKKPQAPSLQRGSPPATVLKQELPGTTRFPVLLYNHFVNILLGSAQKHTCVIIKARFILPM